MIYLHRGMERAACETEAAAERLETRGYKRCSADVHRALWKIADATQQAVMRVEDKRRRQREQLETAPLARAVGEPPKLPPGCVFTSL